MGTEEVLAKAEVAKSTLYRHFASKEELVLDKLHRNGVPWIVIGSPERDGERRHTTVTLRAHSDGDGAHPPAERTI